MKTTTLRITAMLGVFFVLAIASVHAQSSEKMTVNIPFDFTAGSAKLKAGEYTINRYSQRILVVRALDYTKDIFVFSPFTIRRSDRNLSGKLTFHRYGNEYFLAESWAPGDRCGNGVNETGAERRVAKQLAQTNTLPETVEIVASVK